MGTSHEVDGWPNGPVDEFSDRGAGYIKPDVAEGESGRVEDPLFPPTREGLYGRGPLGPNQAGDADSEANS